MNITNYQVYELKESIKASGLPMVVDPFDAEYNKERAAKLGSVKTGTGHDNFLKGIRVAFDLKYTQYFSMQLQRYGFVDIVSSQSKMHRLTKMNIKEQCNEYVDDRLIDILNEWVDMYNEKPTKEIFMRVISNCPMGLELTMRCNTNYQQLKTIYQQRKNHKLEDWGIFCDWIEGLPMFNELITLSK